MDLLVMPTDHAVYVQLLQAQIGQGSKQVWDRERTHTGPDG